MGTFAPGASAAGGDPLSAVKPSWPSPGSLTACNLDSDGCVAALGRCGTPPPPTLSRTITTTTTPSAPAFKYRTPRWTPQMQEAQIAMMP